MATKTTASFFTLADVVPSVLEQHPAAVGATPGDASVHTTALAGTVGSHHRGTLSDPWGMETPLSSTLSPRRSPTSPIKHTQAPRFTRPTGEGLPKVPELTPQTPIPNTSGAGADRNVVEAEHPEEALDMFASQQTAAEVVSRAAALRRRRREAERQREAMCVAQAVPTAAAVTERLSPMLPPPGHASVARLQEMLGVSMQSTKGSAVSGGGDPFGGQPFGSPFGDDSRRGSSPFGRAASSVSTGRRSQTPGPGGRPPKPQSAGPGGGRGKKPPPKVDGRKVVRDPRWTLFNSGRDFFRPGHRPFSPNFGDPKGMPDRQELMHLAHTINVPQGVDVTDLGLAEITCMDHQIFNAPPPESFLPVRSRPGSSRPAPAHATSPLVAPDMNRSMGSDIAAASNVSGHGDSLLEQRRDLSTALGSSPTFGGGSSASGTTVAGLDDTSLPQGSAGRRGSMRGYLARSLLQGRTNYTARSDAEPQDADHEAQLLLAAARSMLKEAKKDDRENFRVSPRPQGEASSPHGSPSSGADATALSDLARRASVGPTIIDADDLQRAAVSPGRHREGRTKARQSTHRTVRAKRAAQEEGLAEINVVRQFAPASKTQALSDLTHKQSSRRM